MLDAGFLMFVAEANIRAGRADPAEWLLSEEALGNLQEIL
eukprot:gene25862-58073_t